MRQAGILAHPSSLPHYGPCGDLGDASMFFLDWLQKAGVTLWQTLPLHPPGGGFSPYSSPSAFAGATYLISLDKLVDQGLLTPADLGLRPCSYPMDSDQVEKWKIPLIEKACLAFAKQNPKQLTSWAKENHWVADWALFYVLCQQHNVFGWQGFPAALRDRKPKALQKARKQFKEEILTEIAGQFLFYQQWDEVRQAAKQRNIQIVGDMPIFVANDGCDAWVDRKLFRWDENYRPDPVSGAPPDFFSDMGQHWGNPLYNWPEHQKNNFRWWIDRFKGELALADWVRIDHFRGFCAAWEIPASANGDARQGSWGATPGRELFAAVKAELNELPFVAEDLGVITPDVDQLREDLDLMGMKVLQFAFDSFTHAYLPHNYNNHQWACYTGTHDNDTGLGWYQHAHEDIQHRFRVYTSSDGSRANWDLIRLAWSSIARWAITPLQDVLGLGREGRMNVPGEGGGNWLWRAHDLPEDKANYLRFITETYGRLPTSNSY